MLIKKVRETVKKYGLINKKDKILIGVSGGPDSLALFYALRILKREFGLSLHVAHLDHGLRKDSAKDAQFVKGLAEQSGIPVSIARIDVRALPGHGQSEEIARNLRLGFFFRVARDIKAGKIALGHNLDDQAETVLMRLIRGTGLCGLSGIIPKRKLYGFWVIRPLIEIRRSEIISFLKRRKITPRIDSTNLGDVYFRNKIRNRLLPLLERQYNRNIKTVLSNLAQSTGYDYDYLERKADLAFAKSKPGINLKGFRKLHPAMQRLLLRRNIRKLQGDTRRITFKHIEELLDLIFNRPLNSVVDLPKGISAKKSAKSLFFFRKKSINT